MKFRLGSLVLALLSAGLLHAGAARAETTDCNADGVLSFIDSRFDAKARNYLKEDIDITGFSRIQDLRIEERDDTHSVERVYCHAKVDLTDGTRRDLWYLIERNWAFAGLGQSVEFCISGLDPWHSYGRYCRSVR